MMTVIVLVLNYFKIHKKVSDEGKIWYILTNFKNNLVIIPKFSDFSQSYRNSTKF